MRGRFSFEGYEWMNIEKWKLEQKWVNETGVWFRWNYCNGKFDWDWNHQRCTSPRCTVVLLLDCQILYLAIFSFCVLDKTLEIMPEPCQVANEWGPLRIYIPLSFYSCPTCFFFFFLVIIICILIIYTEETRTSTRCCEWFT